MIRKLVVACALVLATLAPAALPAQQTATRAPAAAPQMEQNQGVLVVSLQKCHFTTMDEMNAWWRANAAPVLNQLVRDKKLRAWGVFSHMWGDEWNWGIYYIAPDIHTFHSAFDQFWAGITQRDPHFMQVFERACTEHRDNIYQIDMTEMSTMPMPVPPQR